MTMFLPDNSAKSPRHQKIWARYEVVYTIVDFSAAVAFVIGSLFFFFPDMSYQAAWLFLVGSICFAMKPTIRLLRELQYLAMGETKN
ncbi:MAG: N-acetyl-gamma-glutamyl-phosphate reductase [Rhizobiales bacterium]|nr:N-acetyl-gamma-glutamyl-phosphate reductase [Hyphomicrobiales bacterium]